MTDIERYFERAQYHRQREGRHRWVLAMIADKVVGLRDGMTMELANVCGLSSPDAVEHWAKAHDLYRRIRFTSVYVAHKFRDEFTVSHFYSMYDMMNRYNLSISKVIAYFLILLQYKETGESWSVAALEREVEADADKLPVNWEWHWKRLDKHMKQLASFDGELPPVIKAFVKVYHGLKDKVK